MKETIYILQDDLFFKNFRYLRKKHALSCRTLGKLLDMSPYWIQMIEENKWGSTLPASKLVRISQIFDVALHDLLHTDLAIQ